MPEKTYYYNQYSNATGPASFYTIGHTFYDKTLRFHRDNPQYYCFEFCTQGKGVYEMGAGQWPVVPGTLFILYKGIPHTFTSDGNHFEKLWCEFDGFLFDSMIDVFLPDRPPTVYCPAIAEEMNAIFAMADHGMSHGQLSMEGPPQILRIMQKLRTAGQRRERCVPEDIKRWIDDHIYTPFALENLCHEMFFTANHIINTFRDRYGVTPYQYYLGERTRLIGDYLKTSDVPIKELAQLFHMRSAKYLSTFFRRQTGLTPMEWRQAAGGAESEPADPTRRPL